MILLSSYNISGHSMEPALKDGNIIIASNIPYLFLKPNIKDIVLFRDKKTAKIMIKRIRKIKNDRYLLIGDNPHDSLDSRKIGWIERKDIVGKVICIINAKLKNQRSRSGPEALQDRMAKTRSNFKDF